MDVTVTYVTSRFHINKEEDCIDRDQSPCYVILNFMVQV